MLRFCSGTIRCDSVVMDSSPVGMGHAAEYMHMHACLCTQEHHCVQVVVTRSQLDPEGMKLAPKLSKFEEPFTRGAPGDDHQDREPLTELDVKRIAPIAPENRDPADPPLGVLRYWISSNFMVRSLLASTFFSFRSFPQDGRAVVSVATKPC